MHQVTVATDLHRQLRQEDLAKAEKRDVEEHKEARKNRGFTQIYPRGWKRTIELVRKILVLSSCMHFLLNTLTRPVER